MRAQNVGQESIHARPGSADKNCMSAGRTAMFLELCGIMCGACSLIVVVAEVHTTRVKNMHFDASGSAMSGQVLHEFSH